MLLLFIAWGCWLFGFVCGAAWNARPDDDRL